VNKKNQKKLPQKRDMIPVKSINYANCLTLMRILLLPVYLLFLLLGLLGQDTGHLFISFLLYLILGLTDFFDGILARKLKQTTDRGEIMDVLSDYFLLTASYTLFVATDIAPLWMFLIIIWKFLLFLFLSMVGKSQESLILVHDWPGKTGAVLYFLSVGLILLNTIIQPEPLIYSMLMNIMFLFLFGWSIMASIYRVLLWRRLASG
jgi:phosphatidylglycerophosphate synthase